MLQTCSVGSNLQGGAHFLRFTVQAPNKMPDYPPTDRLLADAKQVDGAQVHFPKGVLGCTEQTWGSLGPWEQAGAAEGPAR